MSQQKQTDLEKFLQLLGDRNELDFDSTKNYLEQMIELAQHYAGLVDILQKRDKMNQELIIALQEGMESINQLKNLYLAENERLERALALPWWKKIF